MHPSPPTPDQVTTIIERAAAGNRDAFRRLYGLVYDELARTVRLASAFADGRDADVLGLTGDSLVVFGAEATTRGEALSTRPHDQAPGRPRSWPPGTPSWRARTRILLGGDSVNNLYSNDN